MGKNTNIQWTDASVNYWIGCIKITEGCKNCYMHRDMERYGKDPRTVRRTADATFYQALKWKEGRRIFTNSWSDFFIEEADEWRNDAWDVIRKTPQHQWQILTKRPERIAQCLPPDWNDGWDNVWLGVSIESQKHFNRAEILSQIPAKIRFISAEPLLDELDLLEIINGNRVIDNFHWVIIGGESGNEIGRYRYRPCELNWIKRIISDLKASASHVAVFNKQTGTYLAKQMQLSDRHGGDWVEWPLDLKVREFPVGLVKID